MLFRSFACEAIGRSSAIEPTGGKVYAPVTGTVTMIAETGHAIGLLSDNGTEVLIHIGIDTVNLKGAPFTAHVASGDHVAKGDLLMDVDFDQVRAAGLPATTMVIITNSDDFSQIDATAGKHVASGDLLLDLRK